MMRMIRRTSVNIILLEMKNENMSIVQSVYRSLFLIAYESYGSLTHPQNK